MITEIRAIAADSLWMSPCYRQDSIAIHFTWKQDWPAVSRLLPVIEKELGAFEGAAALGKALHDGASGLRSRYERLPDFLALALQVRSAGQVPQRVPRPERLRAGIVPKIPGGIVMPIQPGDRFPEASFTRMTESGPAPVSSAELFAGKKVVLFGVPGAFTPTCSKKHLPGYVEEAEALKAKGVDHRLHVRERRVRDGRVGPGPRRVGQV